MPVGPAAGPGTKESLRPGTKELLGPGTKESLGPGTKEPLGGGRTVVGEGSGDTVVVGVGGCRQVYGTSGWDGVALVADGMGRELLFGVADKDWAEGRLPVGPDEVESGLRRLNNPVGRTWVSTTGSAARMATGRSRVTAGAGSDSAGPGGIVGAGAAAVGNSAGAASGCGLLGRGGTGG